MAKIYKATLANENGVEDCTIIMYKFPFYLTSDKYNVRVIIKRKNKVVNRGLTYINPKVYIYKLVNRYNMKIIKSNF